MGGIKTNRSCPVCGQNQARFLFRPKKSPGPVSKCLNCGMVYVSDIEDDHALFFDGPASHYQADPKILTSSDLNDARDLWECNYLPAKEAEWPALRQNAVDALIRLDSFISRPSAEGKILDFGSGWGFFLAAARERGWLCYGLEPLPGCAIYARAKLGANIVTDTLHNNTYPADFFDAVTSFQVFEHLPHPDHDVRILHKILRKGGVILIEVPNFDTWTMRLLRSRHRHFVQDHINFFSKETLSRFLKMNGFTIMESFHPDRRMSVRYLFGFWLSKYLPSGVNNVLITTLKKMGLWEITLGINIGDIITVIAGKIM
jgi:2-polyprenyl-3-methyl-5-hydroxy-6-metoxy-1,4-benzoquinol methylase